MNRITPLARTANRGLPDSWLRFAPALIPLIVASLAIWGLILWVVM